MTTNDTHPYGSPHHGHGHGHGHGGDHGGLAELLDLDAEVLHGYLSDVTTWVNDHVRTAERPGPRHVVDLGCGTGTGTIALLERFPQAHVTALDVSEDMLAHLRRRVGDLGLSDRVTTLTADLDQGLPPGAGKNGIDLVWASASLHHVNEPDRVLTDVLTALSPGGLLAVTEFETFPRFLPEAVGDGLEARLHTEMARMRAVDMPLMGSDWGARLRSAGFTVEAERTFTVDLVPPLPSAAPRYARSMLQRTRDKLADRLGAADLALLDTLVGDGPDGVLHRDDLTVHATRPSWVARRL